METKRIELYNRFKTDAEDHKKSDVFRKKYPNYNTWDETNFIDKNAANTIWNKTIEIFEKVDFNTFLKTYACDKDWAKDQEYCKVAPKQDQWVALEEENKTEFLERYPCIASLIKGKGRQKMTSDGMVFILPIVTEGKSCWVYMLDDPDKSSKYNGRIVNMANQEDVGKFECEGDVVSGDENLPKD